MNMSAVAECRATIRHHSKSFSLASGLLPPSKRDEVAVVYTWCRRADDAIDLAEPREQPAALERLRIELEEVYSGAIQSDETLTAFQEVVNDYNIPRHYPDELLAGMQMDIDQSTYRDMPELMHYCYRVAGTVGLMMGHVLGVSRVSALRDAAYLGMAMQLTNICRDVLEDWNRGRMYIPQSMLQPYGSSLFNGPAPARDMTAQEAYWLRAPVRRLLEVAEDMYVTSGASIRDLSWQAALAVRTARQVYARIGQYVLRCDCDVLAGRAYVPKWQKIVLATSAVLQTLVETPTRVIHPSKRVSLTGVIRFPDDIMPLRLNRVVGATHDSPAMPTYPADQTGRITIGKET